MRICADCQHFLPIGMISGQCAAGNDLLKDLGMPARAIVMAVDEADACRSYAPSLEYTLAQVRRATGCVCKGACRVSA